MTHPGLRVPVCAPAGFGGFVERVYGNRTCMWGHGALDEDGARDPEQAPYVRRRATPGQGERSPSNKP